ncbi:MAG: hypothetical protein WCA56_10305 [Xanthobacteraceae bacterium]
MRRNMHRLLCVFALAGGVIFGAADVAAGQDVPPLAILRAIADKLPHRPQTPGTTFSPSGGGKADPVCGLQHFTMTLATGSRSSHSLPVLLDHVPAEATAPVTLMAVLHRVTVDADGSRRTYHPDDPHGTGTCTGETGPDGELHYHGVCALDDFASAHLLVFDGATKLGKGEFEAPWQSIWPLIRDKKLEPIDLKQYVPSAPDGFYLFYWKERNLTALFKREIIPQAPDGYPCRDASGYFVAATTLKADGAACASSRFMDAENRPFIVLPDDTFGNARAGDIVVGRLAGAPADRVVYGVVGDTGPIAQFGEASVAFNRALLGRSSPIMNGHDVDALDISGGPVTVLVLGGTKALLNGDYSRQNIERVGRAEFARWNGDPSDPTQRLDACVREFGAK